MRRAALVVAVVAAIAAPSALAKERVHATLLTPFPASAAPGERVTIRWRLVAVEQGRERPFRAGGVYVRLRSAAGAAPTTGFAEGFGAGNGVYAARVVVPEGGIAGIVVGLRGFRYGPGGNARADVRFPITNPPARAALARPRAGGATGGAAIAIVAGLIGLGLAGYLLLRLGRDRLRPVPQ